MLCLLAVSGCARPPSAVPVTVTSPPKALLTALVASVELEANGLPGRGARAWEASADSGLTTVPVELSIEAAVNGAQLPAGRLTRQFSGLRFAGDAGAYGFSLVVREAGTFAFELTTTSADKLDIAWEVDLPAGWKSRTDGEERIESGKHVQVSKLLVTAPKDSPALGLVPPRIVIEGPKEDQLRLDDLARALGQDRAVDFCGISPFGSSGTKYSSRVFWDADVWLLPALALTHPTRARTVPTFRIQTGRAALSASSAEHPSAQVAFKVPWETGADGSELCTGPGLHAAHVTGSAAWGMGYAARLGLTDQHIAHWYRNLAKGYYEHRADLVNDLVTVPETLSPDEFAMTPSDTYTNLVAHLAIGRKAPYIPTLGDRVLNFEGDGEQDLQQHALLLGLWPLEHPALLPRARQILAHEKGRSTENGPAMSLSIEALLEARYDNPTEAMRIWRRSIDRYAYGPARNFGETPRLPEGSFQTGVAGCWSAVVYGFAGIHIGDQPVARAVWSRKLMSGTWVSARPSLPPEWNSLAITLYLDGEPVPLKLRMGMPAKQSPDSR